MVIQQHAETREDFSSIVLTISIWNSTVQSNTGKGKDVMIADLHIPLSSIDLNEERVFHPYTLQLEGECIIFNVVLK